MPIRKYSHTRSKCENNVINMLLTERRPSTACTRLRLKATTARRGYMTRDEWRVAAEIPLQIGWAHFDMLNILILIFKFLYLRYCGI